MRVYRRVLLTGRNMQLVPTTLRPGEEIGTETHNDQGSTPHATPARAEGIGHRTKADEAPEH